MIAVTIATDDYADLAHEQAKWFRRNSGLQTVILSAKDGYAEKLELQRMFKGKKIVFFDADFRLVRKTDFSEIRAQWAGVLDPAACEPSSFVAKDIALFGMNSAEYINTGLFIADFSCTDVIAAFNDARQMLQDRHNGSMRDLSDLTEQSLLNYAIFKRFEHINIRNMDEGMNCFPMMHTRGWREYPARPSGLHVAGVKLEHKAMVLDAMTATFAQR